MICLIFFIVIKIGGLKLTIPIKEIKLHQLDMMLNNPFSTSFGTVQAKEFYITEIIDNEGNSGFGESVAFSSPWYTEETVQTNLHIMEDFLIKILQNNKINHPKEVSQLFKPIKRNNMAKAALETAIWDLYAKRENTPLYQILGGKNPTIDSGISIGIQPTTADLINTIFTYIEAGYKRVKIKIKPGLDIEVLREVRKYFPNLPLMVDANSAYTLQDIDHLKKLDSFDLMMIEQPLGHDDIVDHATLQAEMHTPICLDESINSLEDTRKAIQLGSCKIINIKIGRVGGIYEAKRIHDYCQKQGIPVWCGGMLEAGVGRAHNIALATLPNFTLPGDIAGSSHYWQKDIIDPEIIVNNGAISVLNKPGIGFPINRHQLEKVTKDIKVFHF